MYFGADYYPEHRDKARWRTDAELMQMADRNAVRIAEFAWSRVEPREDVFDFELFDEAIGIFAEYGIYVIIGTPAAAAPKWLMDKHSDAYPADVYSRREGFGTQRHYSIANSDYRRRSAVITQFLKQMR